MAEIDCRMLIRKYEEHRQQWHPEEREEVRVGMSFERYLESYVRSLTGQRSLRAPVLVNVCVRKDHVREACFFYLLIAGKMSKALSLAETNAYGDEWMEVYGRIHECASFEELWRVEPDLPPRYAKVLRSYYATAHRAEAEALLKRKLRDDFEAWSRELGLSNRSVALRAGIDPSNFSAFVNRQELGRLSLDAVRRASQVYVAEFREHA